MSLCFLFLQEKENFILLGLPQVSKSKLNQFTGQQVTQDSYFPDRKQITISYISLSCSNETKGPPRWRDGDFMLTWHIDPKDWLEPEDWHSWNVSLLPHYQPSRRKSHTLQPSPQILPLQTSPPSYWGWVWAVCSKPFSAPDTKHFVWTQHVFIRHMNLD